MAVDSHERTMACPCLNVRIYPQSTQNNPPDFLSATSDANCSLEYVGDEGVKIMHPQMTARIRRLHAPNAEGSERVRSTTLSCLLCQVPIYRVRQLVPADEEEKQGPLLPTNEWVEKDTLLSSTGWIEVHKDRLTGPAVSQAISSPSYSSTFGVLVPTDIPVVSDSIYGSSRPTPASIQCPNDQLLRLLSDIRPLFPPPPFVPSHPVFSHLASIASDWSSAFRSAAEEYLADIIQQKISEIEQAEESIRTEVQRFWKKVLLSINKIEHEEGVRANSSTSQRRDSVSRAASPGQPPAPLVSIRNFVPVPNSAPRFSSPVSSIPRVSSLSASLATSSFYHPRAQQQDGSPHTNGHNSHSSPHSPHASPPHADASHTRTSSAESYDKPKSSVINKSILQPFRRSMDESKDVATSLRYFSDLDAEMARMRQQQSNQAAAAGEATAQSGSAAGASEDSTTGNASGSKTQSTEDSTKSRNTDQSANAEGDSKKRRKVTFDIKTDIGAMVADSKNGGVVQAAARASRLNSRVTEEMIFDLDEESSDHRAPEASSKLVLRLNETPHIPARPVRAPPSDASGLPSSLSSLRLGSIMSPSNLRSSLVDSDADPMQAHMDRPFSPSVPTVPETVEVDDTDSPFDPAEEEILRLVAANTPSHRGAWQKNSKAWKSFLQRQDDRATFSDAFIPEEEEDDLEPQLQETDESSDLDNHNDVNLSQYRLSSIAASLPIDIGPLSNRQRPFASADQSGTGRSLSSAALRRASYAERDRTRSMDPGALDFSLATHDDQSDESEDDINSDKFQGERSRQRAYKILQARSKIPAAGMWRSLA